MALQTPLGSARPAPTERRCGMRRKLIGFALAGAIAAFSATAFGNPSPPTNAGNGAGQSGQCTGPASERPASCQSSH
jgi:hypothetical protein